MSQTKNAHADLFREDAQDPKKYLHMSLPVPPSVNGLHYNTRGGGKRLTYKAVNYTRDARALIAMHVEDTGWVAPPKGVWLYIDMVFYFPDRRVRDASNCLKLLLDVMQGLVYTNDYIALPRIQSVEYDKENPRVELCISSQDDTARTHGAQLAKQPYAL